MPTFVHELMLNDVAVLTPRTTLREAAAREWEVPGGHRRLRIVAVLEQPRAPERPAA